MTNNPPEQPDFFPVRREDDQVSLSIPSEAFEHFMLSLLGKPEIIEGYVEGAFEIDFGSVQQLNDIIDNRILNTYENSSLIEFKAKLYFNDNSSIEFNSLPSFLGYKDTELRRIFCTGFNFTWSYLIKFPQAESAEKQEISIYTIQASDDSLTKGKNNSSIFHYFLNISQNLPQINYQIRYSNRLWAIDLSEKIKTFLNHFMNNNINSIKRFLRKQFKTFNSLLFFVIYISILYLILGTMMNVLDNNTELIDRELEELKKLQRNQFSTESKMDLIIELTFIAISAVINTRLFDIQHLLVAPLVLYFTSLLTSFVILCINNLVSPPNYKFLLFTPESEKNKRRVLAQSKKRITWSIIGFIGTIVIGIFGGVLANYVYAFLTQ